MRIVVHGQEAFGKAVLEKLLERKENVVAVFCAPDKAGRPEDPLKIFAREKGPPVHQPKSWKTPEALELMKSSNADLCVMAYVHAVRAATRARCTQARHLPVSSLAAAAASRTVVDQLADRHGAARRRACRSSGRTKVSMRVRSCCRRRSTIGPDETLGDVYFKKLFPLGVEAMMESLDLVRAGKAPKVPQTTRRRPTKAGSRRMSPKSIGPSLSPRSTT